jgi:hypothetical protein
MVTGPPATWPSAALPSSQFRVAEEACGAVAAQFGRGAFIGLHTAEPSIRYRGATSYVFYDPGGECHVIVYRDGRIVHGPHPRIG